MYFKKFLFCNSKLKFLKRNLLFSCIFLFTSASAFAGNDSAFYYFDCDTCIHFNTTYESDSLVKCVSYTKEGDTIYHWDSRTGQYIVKISYEIDEFLTQSESWELMNYKFTLVAPPLVMVKSRSKVYTALVDILAL